MRLLIIPLLLVFILTPVYADPPTPDCDVVEDGTVLILERVGGFVSWHYTIVIYDDHSYEISEPNHIPPVCSGVLDRRDFQDARKLSRKMKRWTKSCVVYPECGTAPVHAATTRDGMAVWYPDCPDDAPDILLDVSELSDYLIDTYACW